MVNVDITIGKARTMVLLFLPEASHATYSSMIAHMTKRTDNATFTNDVNRTRPNTFSEAFYKTRKDSEGLKQIIPKTAQNMALAKTGIQQQLRSLFVNTRYTNYRGDKIPQYSQNGKRRGQQSLHYTGNHFHNYDRKKCFDRSFHHKNFRGRNNKSTRGSFHNINDERYGEKVNMTRETFQMSYHDC